MAIYSNVLGYINNKKRGIYEQVTYSELLAMDTAAAVIALLNNDAATYYSQLSTDGHLYNNYIANLAGSAAYEWSDGTVYYSNGTWAVKAPDYKTYTIIWNETSTPGSYFVQYADAAATEGLTQESTAFDKFFNYSAVLLDASGNEVAEVKQSSPGVLEIDKLRTGPDSGTAGAITGANNVMIKFPRLGIKMSKSSSQVTLSITNNPNASGFQYYAFNRNGMPQNQFYLGAFKSSISGSTAKSWATNSYSSNSSPYANITISTSATAHSNNGSNYSQIAWFQRMYVNALYMMKYGNPNSQTKIGAGYTGGSAAVAPGATVTGISGNYATGATNTSSTGRVRLFGLEDRWGNVYEWVDGIYSDAGKYVFVNTANANFYNSSNVTTTASNPTVGVTTGVNSSYIYAGTNNTPNNYYANATGNNWGMFFPNTSTAGSSSTYYCDSAYLNASGFALAGGYWNNSTNVGAFFLYVIYGAASTSTYVGARLMYL